VQNAMKAAASAAAKQSLVDLTEELAKQADA
jgi:hypothetical protein